VDEKYGRYPWATLGGSIVEQRFDAVDSRRMTSIWTTIRGFYDTLYAVPEGTVTNFPFLRSREDWRVCQVLRHLAVREIPLEVEDKPHFSWEYYPGSPPKFGEMDRGFYVPGAMKEWTVRTSLHPLTLYEQHEVRDVPEVRRKALYPTTPVFWEHVEVPRGMAARVPQMVALQEIQLMGEPLGGPYHLMLAALWAVEVADVFLGSICHHGHLWRLPMAIRSVTAGHLALTLGEPDHSQSRGDTWIRVMGGRIRSVRNGRGLSRGKYVRLTHISNRSGGDSLVITPWLTNHNRGLETSLGIVNPRAGPQLRA